MSRPGLLAVFTEGDRVRGLGHVTRCAAYAEGWSERGGEVRWVLDGDDAAVASIGSGANVLRRRWQDGAADMIGATAEVALVDSYVATFEVMSAVAAAATMTVFIDDLGRTYPRGVVVHPAPDQARRPPSSSGQTDWLEGPAWQPLRPAFWTLPERSAVQPKIERILVIFGAGDLRAIGSAMARLASEVCAGTRIDLVLGSGQPEPEPSANLFVHQAIDAAAMASLMLAADVAISAAGQTVFELARCGTPAILVGVADNQQPNLDHWPDLCGYISAGRWDAADRDQRVRAGLAALAGAAERQDVSRRAAEVVDGQGVRRLFDHLELAITGEHV